MKKNLFLGVSVLSLVMSLVGSVANAASEAPATKELCVSFTGVELGPNHRVLGNAKCDITQTMSQAQLSSTWSCSFDGKSSETLKTIATWVSDPSSDGSQTIFFDIFPQEDLGAYLLKGLNMTSVNQDGAFLEVVSSSSPHAVIPDLMLMTNGYSSVYDGLNVTSIQNGSCSK